MKKLIYIFGLCLSVIFVSNGSEPLRYWSLDDRLDSQNIVYEFLLSLDLLYKEKSLTSKMNCERQITRPNQAVISEGLADYFGVSYDETGDNKIFISQFLQQLKKRDSKAGNVKVISVSFCDEEINEDGSEIQRISANVEIKSKKSVTKADLLFVLVKDTRDDIRSNPFKILYINESKCITLPALTVCRTSLKKVQDLMNQFAFEKANSLLNTLNDCDSEDAEIVAQLKEQCQVALRAEAKKESLDQIAEQQTQDSIELLAQKKEMINQQDKDYLKQAKNYFANHQFEKAKQQLLLVKVLDVQRELLVCNNCLKSQKVERQGDTFFNRDQKINAFNNYEIALQLCPDSPIENKLKKVSRSICDVYVSDAETLLSEGNYLDALAIIRQVYSFDPNHKKAKEIENKCIQYNQPDFVLNEIQRAKHLFENLKASRKENAEAFKIFYRYRDSKYMDGESLTYLGVMEKQPKQFGLHKEIKMSTKAFKAHWEVHIKRAIDICKASGNCSRDVNYELSGLEEQLFLNNGYKKD